MGHMTSMGLFAFMPNKVFNRPIKNGSENLNPTLYLTWKTFTTAADFVGLVVQ